MVHLNGSMRRQGSNLVLFGLPQYSFTKADMASAPVLDVWRSLTREGAERITKIMIFVQLSTAVSSS